MNRAEREQSVKEDSPRLTGLVRDFAMRCAGLGGDIADLGLWTLRHAFAAGYRAGYAEPNDPLDLEANLRLAMAAAGIPLPQAEPGQEAGPNARQDGPQDP